MLRRSIIFIIINVCRTYIKLCYRHRPKSKCPPFYRAHKCSRKSGASCPRKKASSRTECSPGSRFWRSLFGLGRPSRTKACPEWSARRHSEMSSHTLRRGRAVSVLPCRPCGLRWRGRERKTWSTCGLRVGLACLDARRRRLIWGGGGRPSWWPWG